ncbi:FAD-dependent monooxygenase [Hydrogenophaga sp.]|uniref:FAD-dependent monooxygenase n=1 Tax=Hydrogenophaga sp. TaxID=1904254 RepID=UPI002717CC9F|nr:FAD-dependent monooxygenase [Hydrogenophaga sp.]MDO8905611.1 FAD-dependent monooxygenase [Hydrogenophaga sp.]
MTQKKKVLVVGSGIGGSTLAYTLQRAGIDAHCIDIKSCIPMTGSGINLMHNTLRALGSIGLAEQCMDSGFPFQAFKQHAASGQLLMTNPAPACCGIRRPELARILESAAEGVGAVLEKDLTVTDLTDRADQVEVTLSDGRQQSYDLVVAADGAYSKLRDRIFGPEHKVWFAGQSCWRFNAPRPNDVDAFCLWRSADGRRTVGAFPTSKETCYFFFLESSDKHLHLDKDQLHTLLFERLAAFSAPALRDSLAHVTSANQVIFRPFDINLVPPPWHRGRVVLLGDAAHSPTPQMTSGGGMAIEDAVVLTECLSQTASVPEALQSYSNRRFERVKTVWDASLQLCRYEQEPVPNPQRSAALLLQTYQYLGQPM